MGSLLTVSVVLCTHNGERFVADQLRSILRQTRMPAQLVISDDASEDSTLAVIDAVLAHSSAVHGRAAVDVVRIVNQPALGVTGNFAGALSMATSDLIALSDQDDIWLPDRLSRMAAEFEARPDLTLLHSDADLVDAEGRPLKEALLASLEIGQTTIEAVHDGRAFDVLLRRNIVTGATVMLRRELVATASPFPSSWLHDEWLAMVAAVTGRLDLLEERLTEYRQHDANQIGAGRLSFRAKLGRMTESGGERNRRLLARAEVLADRVPSLTPSTAMAEAVTSKLAHERMRSGLPRWRPARAFPIAAGLLRGRYRRFGRGALDAARDLLQPHGVHG